MAKGIYVSATTPGSGKSLVALGLADTLHRHADRIGFFKPVVHGDDAGADPMVALMKARFGLDDDRCRGGLTFAEVRGLLAEGKREEIDARCVEIFAEMGRYCDVVIVEGTDLTGQDAAVEFDLNARLANNLAAPVVAVVGAKGLSVAEAAAAVEVARKELIAEKCAPAGHHGEPRRPGGRGRDRRRREARRVRPAGVRLARAGGDRAAHHRRGGRGAGGRADRRPCRHGTRRAGHQGGGHERGQLPARAGRRRPGDRPGRPGGRDGGLPGVVVLAGIPGAVGADPHRRAGPGRQHLPLLARPRSPSLPPRRTPTPRPSASPRSAARSGPGTAGRWPRPWACGPSGWTRPSWWSACTCPGRNG